MATKNPAQDADDKAAFAGEQDDATLTHPSDADLKAAHGESPNDPVTHAASAEAHGKSFGGPVTDARSTKDAKHNTAQSTQAAEHMANAGPAFEKVEPPPTVGVPGDDGRRGHQS